MKWLIVRMGSSFLWAGPKIGRAQNRMCAIRGNTCRAADTVASSEGIRAGLWHTSRSLRRSATAVVVPQLHGDKYVLPLNYPCLEHLLHGIPDCFFIAVAFRTIEVTKSHFQCGLGC